MRWTMTQRAMTRCAVALLLAGCARDDTPASACEHQVYQDPVVKELIIKGAGNQSFQRESEDVLAQAKQRARLACLQGRGVVKPGGVEVQRPL